jgi:hypothetical protein
MEALVNPRGRKKNLCNITMNINDKCMKVGLNSRSSE